MSPSPGAWFLLQAVAGGAVLGVAAMLFAWWRLRRAEEFVLWLSLWLTPVAALLVLNGVLPLTVPASPGNTAALWLRSQCLAGSMLLTMPALRSVSGGPRVRWWMTAAASLFALRALLFLTTDLVYAHRYAEGSPVYGPLITISYGLPALVVLTYVVEGVRRSPRVRQRPWYVAWGLVSLVLLVVAFALETGPLAELLTGLWVLPLVGVVWHLGFCQLEHQVRVSERVRRMRNALADLHNAAWFEHSPEGLLHRAEQEAERVLGVPVSGTLSELPNGKYLASLTAAVRPRDSQAAAFLSDAGTVVASAAERYALYERLDRAAHTCPLTGLPNRRRIDEVVAETWKETGPQDRVAVLFCGLDAFTRVNEELGHAGGDEVIRAAGRALREVAPAGATVGRYGGAEFVLVLPSPPEESAVLEVAEEIAGTLVDSARGRVRSVSVGVVVANGAEVRDAASLVRDADTAMHEAKRRGVPVRLFDRALRERLLHELDLGRRIARAAREDRFEVHFQPVVDARTLQVVAVEALTRLRDDGQLLSPEEWVPVAEENGHIVDIGLMALRAARGACERSGLAVGVNVSPHQLAEPDFVDKVLATWAPAPLERLVVEITESALLADIPLGVEMLADLRDRGVRVAIDDFGTGFSSLARLSRLPVDVLKVDKLFARDLTTDRGRAVLRGIVEIGHASGMKIVVEGVETRGQLDVAVALGADRVQGFLLGRPSAQTPAPVRLQPREEA